MLALVLMRSQVPAQLHSAGSELVCQAPLAAEQLVHSPACTLTSPALPPDQSVQLAYLVWKSVYITKQVSFRNRVLILFDWLKAQVFGRDLSNF